MCLGLWMGSVWQKCACKCLLAIRLLLYWKTRFLVPKHSIYTVIWTGFLLLGANFWITLLKSPLSMHGVFRSKWNKAFSFYKIIYFPIRRSDKVHGIYMWPAKRIYLIWSILFQDLTQTIFFLVSCDWLFRPLGNKPCFCFNPLHLQNENKVEDLVACPSTVMAFPWSEFGRDVDGKLLKMAGVLWLTVYTSLEDLWLEDTKPVQNCTKTSRNPFCLN